MKTRSPTIMNRRRSIPPLSAQRGAAQLFITVALLVAVMLLGITAAIISSTQFKLAGNLQFENIAFNQAEAAAATGQNWLYANAANTAFASGGSCTGPYIPQSCTFDALDTSFSWTDTSSVAVGSDDTKRYRIQKVGTDILPVKAGIVLNCGDAGQAMLNRVDLYRVSARGTTVRGTTRIVQTMVAIPSTNPNPPADPCL